MSRRIAVFSATRADLWPLVPVLERLAADPRVEPHLIASGGHVSAEHGHTIDDLGTRMPVQLIDAGLGSDDSPTALMRVAQREAEGVGAFLAAEAPDLLMVLGDRYELLGVAQAALLHRTPIVHLHGGDVTEGAFDDSIRHAMTKLASLHCCATEAAGARVRSMGEEAWRVHVTGAPALDGLVARAADTPMAEWHAAIGGPPNPPFGVLTYHPPTLAPECAAAELESLLDACSKLATVVATFPGADPGSQRIVRRLREWSTQHSDVRLVPSLGAQYAATVANADIVVGNSSSGIVEVPSFGVPVVNVGSRQEGRERAVTVIDAPTPHDVAAAVDRGLDPAFRAQRRGVANPYGDGSSARRIVDAVAEAPLDRLLSKRFVDREQQ